MYLSPVLGWLCSRLNLQQRVAAARLRPRFIGKLHLSFIQPVVRFVLVFSYAIKKRYYYYYPRVDPEIGRRQRVFFEGKLRALTRSISSSCNAILFANVIPPPLLLSFSLWHCELRSRISDNLY